MTMLLAATEDDFRWLLGGSVSRQDLRLPDGGVDAPDTIRVVRAMARRVLARHNRGAWLIVSADEIVGLCSYKNAPTPPGEVEIGFGIAASRRRMGHATRAIAALLTIARSDSPVRTLLAETAVANLGSQHALGRNGFLQVGARADMEDGDTLLWRHDL